MDHIITKNRTTMKGTLTELLLPHWETHQRNDDSGGLPMSVENRARRIVKELHELEVSEGIEHLSLKRVKKQSETTLQQQFADCLSGFLNDALVSLVKTNGKSLEAVEAVCELTAAVACNCEVALCVTLVNTTVAIARVQLDVMRTVAAKTIGFVAKHAMQQSTIPIAAFTDVLDLCSQTLLPLFTDKVQAVRAAAIQAGTHFFKDDLTDPDILQALTWSMQHDPSFLNRLSAVQSIPVTMETIDFLIQRVRDIKPKVRVAALNALQVKCHDIKLLEAYHCAMILKAGYTERCSATKFATEQLVCLGWMKLVQFNPSKLLEHVAVSEHSDIGEIIVSILFAAVRPESPILESMPESDARAFIRAVNEALISLSADSLDTKLNAPGLFLTVSACKHAKSPSEKDLMLNQVVPDIFVLCQYLERAAVNLIRAIEEENHTDEDNLAFVCVQLLKLAVVTDLEEGSKQLMRSVLSRLLKSVLTPEDLVEEAVNALHLVSRNNASFLDDVCTIVADVEGLNQTDDGLHVNRKLRILSILTFVLEKVGPNDMQNTDLITFSGCVIPAIRNDNELLREAAVICMGKLGLFMSASNVKDDFQPTMLRILHDDSEKYEIRAQAVLSLADWSVLNELNMEFASFLSTAVERESFPKGLVAVAAEAVMKLLLQGKISNYNWLAALLVILFDPSHSVTEEDGDVTQVGNFARLQQVLTVFFPAYFSQKVGDFEACLNCLPIAIDIAIAKMNDRKKASARGIGRKSTKSTWPVSKMIDYVVDVAKNAAAVISKVEGDNDNESDERSDNPSNVAVTLIVAVHLSHYMNQKMDEIGTTLLRSLCKWIGSQSFDVSVIDSKHVYRLKRALDEFEMGDPDSSCTRHLTPLTKMLKEVASDDGSSDHDDERDGDDESLNGAFQQLGIASVETPRLAKENEFSERSSQKNRRSARLGSRPVNKI